MSSYESGRFCTLFYTSDLQPTSRSVVINGTAAFNDLIWFYFLTING